VFDFDPFDESIPALPELDKIDRTENARDKQRAIVAIRIDHDLCEATGVCAEICPEDVIEHVHGHSSVVRPEACTECWLCVENCVSGAIEIG
jgi:ferredoxin